MSFLQESKVLTILPSPFAWCDISGGEVKIIDSTDETLSVFHQRVFVRPFAIAKYPITNAQYAAFMNAGGYQNKHWWTREGWKLLKDGLRWINHRPELTGKAWTEPLFWQDSKWNGADYPVVGISWYEAFAFCRWLSAASGENITLPSEPQWQRAAEGDEKRIYPWGNEWDSSRCNNTCDGQASGQTTPVRQYEGKGDSPFGVVDMAGNIREWCLTKSSGRRGSTAVSGADDRITRGGDRECVPFKNEYGTTRFFRNDCQNGMTAHACDEYTGFRIVRLLQNV